MSTCSLIKSVSVIIKNQLHTIALYSDHASLPRIIYKVNSSILDLSADKAKAIPPTEYIFTDYDSALDKYFEVLDWLGIDR